jgi:hypothetical protein
LEVETPHGANLKHTADMNEATTTVPLAPKEIKFTPLDEARFWAKVDKNGPTQSHMETPCWLWTAAKSRDGYGVFGIGSKLTRSHRFAWVLTHGPIPHHDNYHGACVLHRCDTPACCRPDHLAIGTQTDNMRDMVTKGRNGSKTHPERVSRGDKHHSRTHPECRPRGEKHRRAKLTDDKVIQIRSMHAAKAATLKSMAHTFGVSLSLITQVVYRKIWRHI